MWEPAPKSLLALGSCGSPGFTMTERTPLLHYRLAASVNEAELWPPPAGQAVEQHPGTSRQTSAQQRQPKKLSVFFGVVIPTLLSMFSVVVFLRIGEFPRVSPNGAAGFPDILIFS